MNAPMSQQEQRDLINHLHTIFPLAAKARIIGTGTRVRVGYVEPGPDVEPLANVLYNTGDVEMLPAAVLEPVEYVQAFKPDERVVVHRANVFPSPDGGVPRRWYRPAARAAIVTGFFWFKYEVTYLDGSTGSHPAWHLQVYNG